MVKSLPKTRKRTLINLDFSCNTRAEFIDQISTSENIALWGLNHPTMTVNGRIREFFKYNTWQTTYAGAIMLCKVYNYYNIVHQSDGNDMITGKILVGLDKIMLSPWHLSNNELIIWDQNKHFEMQLLDCDLNRFVDFNSIDKSKYTSK